MSGLSPDRSRALAVGSNLAADAVAGDVVAAFERRGIPSLLLRGPAIARWLYEEGERTYYDVDLLVDPGLLSGAEETLLALGFRGRSLQATKYSSPSHAEMWVHGRSPPVDLHRTIIGVEASDRDLWGLLAEGTESINLQGVEVNALDRPGLLFVVTLHAAQHGFEAATSDLALALDRVGIDEWREAARLAERAGGLAAFTAGLRMFPEGRQVADCLKMAARPTSETLLRAEVAPDLALGLNWMADLPSARARGGFVISKLFPNPSYMRSISAGARRGRLGLVVAYARRIVWLVTRAPRAMRAVRSARRRASGKPAG